MWSNLGEVRRAPGDRRHLLAVALERHGGKFRIRDLEEKIRLKKTNTINKPLLLKWRNQTGRHLPDVRVVVTRAAGQELVVWADGGLDVERGVLVSAENCHCGGRQTKSRFRRAEME